MKAPLSQSDYSNYTNLLLNIMFICKLTLTAILISTCFLGSAQIEYEVWDISSYEDSSFRPSEIEYCDIDGDGDFDIVTLDAYKVMYYENLDGNGTMALGKILFQDYTNSFPDNVSSADIDMDGDIDLIFGSVNHIYWLENTGNGNFTERQEISDWKDYTRELSLVDIDHDGYLEILVMAHWNSIIYWIDNGPSGFGNVRIVIQSEDNYLYKHINAGDIDLDGDIDIVFSTFKYIVWLENDGSNTNFIPTLIGLEFGAEHFELIDIDNDDDLDIVACSWDEDSFVLFKNEDGLGKFSDGIVIKNEINRPYEIRATDLNADGYPDIVATTYDGNSVYLFYNNGNGEYGEAIVLDDNHGSPVTIQLFDIDQDNDVDIVTGARSEDKLSLFKNDGNGNYGQRLVLDATKAAKPKYLKLKDLDNDGDLDIVCVSSQDHSIRWFENIDGLGTYLEHLITNQATENFHVEIADINNDEYLDIVGFSEVDKKVFYFKNLIASTGGFSSETIIDEDINYITNINVNDLNGNGHKDLILWHRTSDSHTARHNILYFQNDGSGFSEPQKLTPEPIGFKGLIVYDIDYDNDLDILTSLSSKMRVYINDGNNFGEPETIEIPGQPHFEKGDVTDLNQDGILDIIFYSPNRLHYLLGDTIENLEIINTGLFFGGSSQPPIIAAATGDMDNDGDLDLIVNSSISWIENLGGFKDLGDEQLIHNPTYNKSNTLDVGDIDSDGDVDIIFNETYFNNIKGIRNNSIINPEIWGKISIDINDNGCSSESIIAENVKVSASTADNTYSTFTNNFGIYQIFPTEGEYLLEAGSGLPEYYTISNDETLVNLDNSTGIVKNVNYCAQATEEVHDIRIYLYPTTVFRPGFETSLKVVIENHGTTTEDASVDIEYDNLQWTHLSSSISLSQESNNTLSYILEDILPFQKTSFNINFKSFPPPTNEDQDPVEFRGVATINNTDINPSDNEFKIQDNFVNSYDPNDISVIEGHEILQEELSNYLHYFIRFQNTGSAEAVNIRVENILDENLDWSTFEFISASHPTRIEILDNKEVNFIFDNIYLPDSTNNESLSHGDIMYRIKPKSNLEVGDIIPNQVDIFFDFNPPITTNEVETKVIDVVSVNDLPELQFQITPNPNQGEFEILLQKNKKYTYQIFNQLGHFISSGDTIGSVSLQLESGIYYIEVKDNHTKQIGSKLITVF